MSVETETAVDKAEAWIHGDYHALRVDFGRGLSAATEGIENCYA